MALKDLIIRHITPVKVNLAMIYLKSIEQSNAIHELFPGNEGKYWVNFNWYWLELSKRRPMIKSKFIFLEGNSEPVGFMAYGQHYSDRQLINAVVGDFEIYHIVIDVNYQRKGIGRLATILSIKEIAKDESCKNILVACNPQNKSATQMYEDMGFIEFGRNYDGDPLYKLTNEQAQNLIPVNLNVVKVVSPQKFSSWENESIASEKSFSWDNWEKGLET